MAYGRTDKAPPFLKRLVRLCKAEKRAAVRAPFWWLQRLDFIECEVIDATGKEDGDETAHATSQDSTLIFPGAQKGVSLTRGLIDE